MRSKFIFLLLLSYLIGIIVSLRTASIYTSSNDNSSKYIIKYGVLDTENALAYASYYPDLEKVGWDKLILTTNSKYADEETSFAAGYLEGVLTANRIYNHHQNLHDLTWGNKQMPDLVKEYLRENRNYIISQQQLNPTDKYWNIVYLLQLQFDGLVAGYNNNELSLPSISYEDFHTMSSFGDLFDIKYYKNYSDLDFFSQKVEKIQKYIFTNNHCSALIKLAEDFSDIFFGHNSWFFYTAITRIFKEYNFNFRNDLVKSKSIMFSSYAATLASTDDYYITSSNLAVIETTNPMFNSNLYEKLTPKLLMTWQRAMIANRISDNSKQWTEIFAKENSGTYNNQFMALDLKQINLKERKINANALWVIEQIPGYTEAADVSNHLYDHWPSYNVPFFENIRKISMVDDMLDKHPELESSLSYDKCARAQIFKRDHRKVKNLDNFKRIMRYNDYNHDPLSLSKPSNAIASRMDLDENSPICMGAYDGKVSSYKSLLNGRSVNIISGPTNDDVPTFVFSQSKSCDKKRVGLPDKYAFKWIEFNGQQSVSLIDSPLKFLEE